MNVAIKDLLSDTLGLLRALRAQGRYFARQQRLTQAWRRRGVIISDRAILTIADSAHLDIGAGSMIGDYTILDLTSDPHPSGLGAGVRPKLVIGRCTAINEFNNIRAAGGTIKIGNNCLVAQFVSIIASNHSIDIPELIREAPWDMTRNFVEIGDDVWVGTHAVILPGVRIGDSSVIAAGAVVTSDVPAGAIVAGVPARIKRFRPPVNETTHDAARGNGEQ